VVNTYTLPSRSKQTAQAKTCQRVCQPERSKTKRKKHENTTICIVHSTLRDATTPYTERCKQ